MVFAPCCKLPGAPRLNCLIGWLPRSVRHILVSRLGVISQFFDVPFFKQI
jgi:hypothetical protein